MSWHPALLKGLAEHIVTAGLGVYRESGEYTPTERGIVMQTYPERPPEIIAISLYLPESMKLSPTAVRELKDTRVQIRYRLAGHPFAGLEFFDKLHALIDRQHLPLGDVAANGRYVSFASIGQDTAGRHEFTTNWDLTGLASL